MSRMLKIPLTRGKYAIVGPRDYTYLMQWKWCCSIDGYAVRHDNTHPKRPTIRMHRVILERALGRSDFVQCDHINQNRLDNRRSNLRPATVSQNQCNRGRAKDNTSGYSGVSWHKATNRWQARVYADGKLMHTSRHSDLIEAAKAYNEAALKHHGKFAVLNEIPPQQRTSQ